MKRITARLQLTPEQIDALQPLQAQAIERYAHFYVISEPFLNSWEYPESIKFTVVSEAEGDIMREAIKALKKVPDAKG